MSGRQELWAARDPDGDLFLYVGAPKITTVNGFKTWGTHLNCNCIGELPDALYPQVKPGKRWKLVLEAK